MIHPLVAFLAALAAGLAWLEGQSRLATRFGGGRDRWQDLAAFGLFLALLAAMAPGTTRLVPGLAAASAILVVGGWLARQQGLGSRGLQLAEIAAFLCLIRSGVAIHFIQRLHGGYVFLDGWSTVATLAWFLVFVSLIRFARALPGLYEAVLALLSFILLGTLSLQQHHAGPDAVCMSLTLSGMTTALWLHGHRAPARRMGAIAASLWATSLAVLPVVTAIKRIALISLVTPLLILVAPVLFFTYVMLASYVVPNLASRRGARWAFRWKLSPGRAVDLVMLFCLIGNMITLVYAYTSNWLWAAGLAAISMVVYWRLVSFVLLADKTERKSLATGEPIEILGIPFQVEGFEDVLRRVESLVEDGRPHYLITPDALSLLRTTQSDEYRDIVLGADLRVPDGAGVVWAADVLYESPLLERIPGVELVDRLAALAEQRGWSLYLLGARPDVLPAAVEALRARYPALRIAGARHGYFTAAEEPAILEEIERLRPQIVLVAMGVPRQELWIAQHLERLGCSLMMGVGGSFDVLAGAIERAPLVFRTVGLEWLYRGLREPHRLSRILLLPLFVKEVLHCKLLHSVQSEQRFAERAERGAFEPPGAVAKDTVEAEKA